MTHGNSQPGFTPDEAGHSHNPYQAPGSEGSTSPYGQAPQGAGSYGQTGSAANPYGQSGQGAGSYGQTGSAANPYAQAEQPQYGEAATGQRFDSQSQAYPASATGYGNSHNQAAPAGNSFGVADNGNSYGAAGYGTPNRGTAGFGAAGQSGPVQIKVIAGLDMNDDSTKWIAGFAIASFVAFIGTFLPWLKATAPFVGTISVSGINGDGMIIFGLALFGVGTAAFALYHEAVRRLPWRAIPLMVLAALALLVAIFGLLNVASGAGSIREYGGSVSPGFGLILIFLASIGMTACSVLAFLADKKNNPGPLFGGQGSAFQSGQTLGAQNQPYGTAPAQAYGDQPAAQQHAESPNAYGAQQYGAQQYGAQPNSAAPYATPNAGTHTAPQYTSSAQPHYGSQPAQAPHTPSDSTHTPEAGTDTQA